MFTITRTTGERPVTRITINMRDDRLDRLSGRDQNVLWYVECAHPYLDRYGWHPSFIRCDVRQFMSPSMTDATVTALSHLSKLARALDGLRHNRDVWAARQAAARQTDPLNVALPGFLIGEGVEARMRDGQEVGGVVSSVSWMPTLSEWRYEIKLNVPQDFGDTVVGVSGDMRLLDLPVVYGPRVIGVPQEVSA